jgi:hypothetical protein
MVVLPTPPFGLASVTTRSRGGCLGAMWYLIQQAKRDGLASVQNHAARGRDGG